MAASEGGGPRGNGPSEAEAPRSESAAEALGRARGHAAAAVSESIAALEALLDAATLAAGEAPALVRARATLVELLQGLRALVEPEGAREGAELADALLGALDAEIERWEARSREAPEDADARAVLRAFLGVREVVWELRSRRGGGSGEPGGGGPGNGSGGRGGGSGRARVRRVPVEE